MQAPGVTFGFIVEVGVKKVRRESFEWRKAPVVAGEKREDGGHTVKTL